MSLSQQAATVANESFAALFEESLSRQEMRAGEVITAEVVRVDYNFVVVNAGPHLLTTQGFFKQGGK